MEKRIRKKENSNRGITLIALVITIIVLLILAGISIAMLTGENGILTKADTARKESGRAEVIENAKLDILEYETENEGKITDDQAYGIIAKYDKDYNENVNFEFKVNEEDEEYFTTKEGYDILVREIWIATKKEETINFTIDGKLLVAKKNETWLDWLVRMKDEPEEVVGRYVYIGWHERFANNFDGSREKNGPVYFVDYGSIPVYLYEQTSGEKVFLDMLIESERRILSNTIIFNIIVGIIKLKKVI